MAVAIIIEFLVGFIMSLVAYIFVMVPFHDAIMEQMFGMGLVMSTLDYQVADVIGWAVVGLPMLILIGGALYAYNAIIYRTGG
jgi:hypothetical protein